MQPLIGNGGFAPGMYAYGIFRNAIEWAFEAVNLPIVKVSPWPYFYNAAYLCRHDFENSSGLISSIESSAQHESSVGAKGDYYFCTGTLREEMGSEASSAVAGMRRAVSLYGATIGSHNGGLKNPSNPNLSMSDYEYWHWGPDEALDFQPAGYASGKDYACASISSSLADIDNWLTGLDTNKRNWVAPYFNATREDSYEILEELGIVTAGDQKLSPFPHWTVSTRTQGKRFSFVSLPVSDWYIGLKVAQAMESDHTSATIHALVDYYYGLGALINLYMHNPSTSQNPADYIQYCAAKPAILPANATSLYEWWTKRSTVQVVPSYTTVDDRLYVTAAITGATDPDTAIECFIPNWALASSDLQVTLDGAIADVSKYRTYNQGIKVNVGATVSVVGISYPISGGEPVIVPSSLSLSPTSVQGGGSSTGTLTLSGQAPTGGAVVSLVNSNPAAATVPASVTVPAGVTTATFTVASSVVDVVTEVSITASYNGTSRSATLVVLPTGGSSQSFSSSISASSDDAEEFTVSNGWMYLAGNDLELIYDTQDQIVGMRFNGIPVPSGATILEALVQFTVKQASTGTCSLVIRGQAVDNAPTFTTTYRNISDRPLTSAAVSWIPASWPTVGVAGQDQQTPDLSSVLQEIVSRPGWQSGNSLALIVTGSGTRTAVSYDLSPSQAPQLLVRYSTSSTPTNQVPVANDQAVTTAQDTSKAITLTGSDADGDALTYSVVTGPAHGALSGTAPNLTYTPTSGYSGSDSFTFKVNDGKVDSNVATVTITVGSVVTYALTPYVMEGKSYGSVSPSARVYVASGSSFTFTFTPIVGHSISGVWVDGTSVGTPTSYTFTNINRKHYLDIRFQ